MDISAASRVSQLSAQIKQFQQALFLLDHGGTITSLTLRMPDPEPEVPTAPPSPPGEDDEQATEAAEPPDALARAEREWPVGEVTISAEGMTYPPQMLQAIRTQQIQFWQRAYTELSQLGVTNVAPPPQ